MAIRASLYLDVIQYRIRIIHRSILREVSKMIVHAIRIQAIKLISLLNQSYYECGKNYGNILR